MRAIAPRSVLCLVLAFVAAALGLGAQTAAAHSGGRAVVLVKELSFVPAGAAWQANVTLTDNDSGSPIQGPKVTALVGSPAKEVTLKQGTAPGLYQGTVAAKPGSMTFALKVRATPGTEPVMPFDSTPWNVQLVAGETAIVVGGSDDGGGVMPIALSVAGALLGVGLLYGLYSTRRKTAVPARAR
ncbi:MAG: hypothetical protein ACT4QG_06500 [Sporichthyaceae bacterium]